VFWHGLQHVLRMNALLGTWAALGHELRFFLRRAAPLPTVSIAALALPYCLAGSRAAASATLISLALLVASVVTLLHALLVPLALDAARWQRLTRPAAAEA